MVEMALRHVYKKYDNAEKYSVTDFNLEIADREFIVFVGPSGCGKSTFLKTLNRMNDLIDPPAGGPRPWSGSAWHTPFLPVSS